MGCEELASECTQCELNQAGLQIEKDANDERLNVIEQRANLQARAEELRAQMRESLVYSYKEEARNRYTPSQELYS